MLDDDQLDRYARHIVLREIGGAGQAKLLKSHITVIGAGGLGAPLLAYLAAAGIGRISLFDDDIVSLSNLQRQIIYREEDIDINKALAAKRFLLARDHKTQIDAFPERFTARHENILDQTDLIVDCTDNFKTRLLVNDLAVKHKVTLVSAAIAGFEGQLSVFKPHANETLPCYRCFVPEEPPVEHQQTCSDTGILGTVAGMIGTLQAQECIKQILDLGEGLEGKMMIVDGLTYRQRIIKLPRDPACKACGHRAGK